MKVSVTSEEKGKTRRTKIGKPKKAFTAVIHECELAMNFSYGSAEAKDEDGNPIKVFIWINGDWKVEYKGKEYVISMDDNVNALIEWINEQDE